MAAAYAALVSLMNVLTRIQHPTCPVSLDKSQIQSLFDKVSSLVDFLDAYSERIREVLMKKLTSAAYAAEDLIESYIVVRIRANIEVHKATDVIPERSGRHCDLFFQDLHKLINEMDLIIHEAMQVREKHGGMDQLPKYSAHVRSLSPPSATIKMVGFDEELISLMDQLTATYQLSRKILPVVGMGGIGKTTLARNVYDRSFVVNCFHVRAWVTVSQDYSVREIIACILRGIGVGVMGDGDDQERLGEQLHRSLFGRKYLIVLDDVWSSLVWDMIRRFLPDNNNGSRILVTTRLSDVAVSVGSCSPYQMKLLDDDKSWGLLLEKVFGQEVCPVELVICGKEIAKGCKGLPLALIVIGGLLSMSDKKLGYWEHVRRNLNYTISREDDDYCLKILSLSYHQMPVHLKPCFLYLAAFPEDFRLHVSELIMWWASDGFLKPAKNNTSEDVALEYLNDLASRNLVMVDRRDVRGRIEVIVVHDLIREICIREAKKEMFLYVIKEVAAADHQNPEIIETQRRIFVRGGFGPNYYPGMRPMRLARSFINLSGWVSPPTKALGLVRLLVLPRQHLPKSIHELVNVRVLKISVYDDQLSLFGSISFLWNLETLIVDDVPEGYTLPCEIWKLKHLKHLQFSWRTVRLSDPPSSEADLALNNLHTLDTIDTSCLSYKVLHMIPNIKRLGIRNSNGRRDASHCFDRLVNCSKLESLACDLLNQWQITKFPLILRELTLYTSYIPWQYMTIIGSLPNLEVLNLKPGAFTGEEWNSNEGEFQLLKSLEINDCDLVTWRVECCSHFPKLGSLTLRNMDNLVEIPQVFGESNTLETISLIFCPKSIVLSAKQILEEHQSQGNDDLKVYTMLQCNSSDMDPELQIMADDNFFVRGL